MKRKADYIKPDRIDLHCELAAVPFSDLSKLAPGEPSSVIRERVIKARQIQEARFKDIKGVHCNAQMSERMLHQYAEPDAASMDMLRMAMERLKLSARIGPRRFQLNTEREPAPTSSASGSRSLIPLILVLSVLVHSFI